MASYEQGYEDDRFENAVTQNFHCPICLNVLKEPMMCQRNQHCFCRPCITRHLRNSQTCPTCMEELTAETLSEAPRIFKVCLSELNIRCDYSNRGCREFVQLGNLETHVKNCGFSPVSCSNQGCLVEINKRDRTRHETEACEFRKVKCHECSELRKDIDEMKIELTAVKNNLEEMQMNFSAANNEMRTNMSALKDQMKQDMTTLTNEININSQAVNEKLAEMKDITSHLMEIKDKLGSLPNERVGGLSTSQVKIKKEMTCGSKVEGTDGNHCIVIAGNRGYGRSVELFDWSNKKWIPLSPMKEGRYEAASFVFKDQMFVTGGVVGGSRRTHTMERVNINPVMDSKPWFDFPAKLPRKLNGHSSVVYDEKLIIIGGHDGRRYSDNIHEVLLVPPYTSKLLTTMPQERCGHGAQLFSDKILICGGSKTGCDSIDSVIMYDISKNECKQMSPLPYAVCDMATVSWGDNVIVIGGADKDGKALNTVVIYNVKTGKSHMLPAMKCRREGCVAVVVSNTIVVMGGLDEGEVCLSSVESFSFESYSWEDLPPTNETRWLATAIAW